MNTIKSKKRFCFATFAGICVIVAFVLLIGAIAGFTIKVVVDQGISFNNKGLIRVVNNNMTPEIEEGKLCMYHTNIADVDTGDIVVVLQGGVYSLRRVDDIVDGAYYVSDNKTTMIVTTEKIIGKHIKQMNGLSNWFDIFVSYEFWICLVLVSIIIIMARIVCFRLRRIKNIKLMINNLIK